MEIKANGLLSFVDEGDIFLELSPSVIFIDLLAKYELLTSFSTRKEENTLVAAHHQVINVNTTIKDSYGNVINDLTNITITDSKGNSYINGSYTYIWHYGDIITNEIITVTADKAVTINNTITHVIATKEILIIPRRNPLFSLEEVSLYIWKPYNNELNVTAPSNISYYWKKINGSNITYDVLEGNMQNWTRANSLLDIIDLVESGTQSNVWISTMHLIRSINDSTGLNENSKLIRLTLWSTPVLLKQNNSLEIEEKIIYMYARGSARATKDANDNYSITYEAPSLGLRYSSWKYDINSDCIRKDENYCALRYATAYYNNNALCWSELLPDLFYSDITVTIEDDDDNPDNNVLTIGHNIVAPTYVISKGLLIHKSNNTPFINVNPVVNSNNPTWSTPVRCDLIRSPVYLDTAPILSNEEYEISLESITGLINNNSSDLTTGYGIYNRLWKYWDNSTYLQYRLLARIYEKNSESDDLTMIPGTNLIYNNLAYEIKSMENGIDYTVDDNNNVTIISANTLLYKLNTPTVFENSYNLSGNIKIITLYRVAHNDALIESLKINNDMSYLFDINKLFYIPQYWSETYPTNIPNGNSVFMVLAVVMNNNNVTTVRKEQWTLPINTSNSYYTQLVFMYNNEISPVPISDYIYYNWSIKYRLDLKITLPETHDENNLSIINGVWANKWSLYPKTNNGHLSIMGKIIATTSIDDNTVTLINANSWSDIITIQISAEAPGLIVNNKKIIAIKEQYFLSTSETLLSGTHTWTDTPDEWQNGMYYWTRNEITWDNNTISYTIPKLAVINNNINTAMLYIDSNMTNINHIFKLSSRPLTGYSIGDLWYYTRPNSTDVLEYICISVTDGAPSSDWMLFNRITSSTIMNVDTKSGNIDILAGLNFNLSANKKLTISGNERLVAGSDGNVELYAGNLLNIITGALDGHLGMLSLDKTGLSSSGQNIQLLTNNLMQFKSNNNILILSDSTSNSYILFGTNEDPNKLILSPNGIECISGNFLQLTVNGKKVLTSDWLSHPIIVSTVKPPLHDIVWIYPEDTVGHWNEVGTSLVIIKSLNKAALPAYLSSLTDPCTGKLQYGRINYPYDDSKATNASVNYAGRINLGWLLIGLTKWNNNYIDWGQPYVFSVSWLNSLTLPFTGSGFQYLNPSNHTPLSDLSHYDTQHIDNIILHAGSQIRFETTTTYYVTGEEEWDSSVPEEYRNYWPVGTHTIGGTTAIFKTLKDYPLSYNGEIQMVLFFLDYNIDTDLETPVYSSESGANLTGLFYDDQTRQEWNSPGPVTYEIESFRWTTAFRLYFTDESDNNPTGHCCVPLLLHPAEINEPYYKIILTQKSTASHYDDLLLTCLVNYVI